MMMPIRRILFEIGRRLTAEEKLDAADRTVYLTLIDLTCWLRGYWNGEGARELIRDRMLRRESWLAETAPDLIVEQPGGRVGGPGLATAPMPIGADGWIGIAVSPGRAEGAVRVLRSLDESARLQPGDVLAAPSTDPGWTPLLLRASAVIVETGGFLSHGAIVAREFGIPAVANLPGILDALHDGERVVVDGSHGRVMWGEL
jgi:pyruvate,water dikinase